MDEQGGFETTTRLASLDGNVFTINDSNNNLIIIPNSLEDFFKFTSNNLRVLVGPKGIGKSILLKRKRFQDKNKLKKSALFLPFEENRTETFILSEFIIPLEVGHISAENWAVICQISILLFINKEIYFYNEDDSSDFIEKEFENILNQIDLNLESILERDRIGQIFDFICTKIDFSTTENMKFAGNLRTSLVNFYKKIKPQDKIVNVYFDNIDQALNSVIYRRGSENSTYGELTERDKTWLNIQIGFLIAIFNVNELDKDNLKIYSTLRQEVFSYLNICKINEKPQLRAICKEIEYSKEEFNSIYKNLLLDSNITENTLKKYGIDHLNHDGIKNKYHNTESLREYILRHTLNNPREIVYQVDHLITILPNMVTENDPAKNQKVNGRQLKDSFTNNVFSSIYQDLIAETIPAYPEKTVMDFIKSVGKNYFKGDEVTMSIVNFIYKIGLIGVVRNSNNHYYISFFTKNTYYSNLNATINKNDTYVLHPILDHLTHHILEESVYYYHHSIVGNGNDFHFLRERDYYIPKSLNKSENDLIQNQKERKDIFIEFYGDGIQDTFNKFQEIKDSSIKWAETIYNDKISKEEAKIKMHNEIYNFSSKFVTLEKTASRNINNLKHNITMRILTSIFLLYRVGILSDILHNERHTRDYTFFLNIRFQEEIIDLRTLLDQLSYFEVDIIYEIISFDTFEKFRKKHSLDSQKALIKSYMYDL